jgi:hypothetical protein
MIPKEQEEIENLGGVSTSWVQDIESSKFSEGEKVVNTSNELGRFFVLEVKGTSLAVANVVEAKLRGSSTNEWSTDVEKLEKVFELQKLYEFDSQSEVTAYLIHNLDLIPILETIPDQIFTYLPDSKLFLSVVTDPEISNYVRLYAWVVPTFEPEDAYERLMNFKRNWWFRASNAIRGKLFVAIDYR